MYEIRVTGNTLEKQIEFARIARQETIDRTESSFAGNGKMTQDQYKQSMKLADEMASKLR